MGLGSQGPVFSRMVRSRVLSSKENKDLGDGFLDFERKWGCGCPDTQVPWGVVSLSPFVGSMISLGPRNKQLGEGVGSCRGLYSP